MGRVEREWTITVYPFDQFTVMAATQGQAKYRGWKALADAGYFPGRQGFWAFLTAGSASASESFRLSPKETGDG